MKKKFPKLGQMVFFDRSWYSRALIEPTMGYCTKSQYKYFMRKVLDWEHGHIEDGLILIKLYLSVNKVTQLICFQERITDELKFWKFSENDEVAREKRDVFTNYKEQMLNKTSSDITPWAVINSNHCFEAHLTSMLYIVEQLPYARRYFKPLKNLIVVGDECISFAERGLI